MKLTRKQIYAMLVGVGLLALILDRTVLSDGPARAKGAQTAKSQSGANTTQDPTQEKVRIGIPDFPVAELALPLHGGVRNPFRMSDAAKIALMPDPDPEPEKTEKRAPAEPFADRHLLSAIIQVGETRLAILDEEISLAVGQRIEACTVVEITGRSVRFACQDEEPILRFNGPIDSE